MNLFSENKFQLKAYVMAIADTNYFNEKHKILRVSMNDEWFDFKYLGFPIVPNPSRHVALVLTCEEFLQKTRGVKGWVLY